MENHVIIADFHLKSFNLEEAGNLAEGTEREWKCKADIFVNPANFVLFNLQINKENEWMDWIAPTRKLINLQSTFSDSFTWKANRTLNGIKIRCVIIYSGQNKNITADNTIQVKCINNLFPLNFFSK